MTELNVSNCAMYLKVVIIGTILGTVVSNFADSTKIIDEFKRDLIDNKKCLDTEQWSLVDNDFQGYFSTFYKSSVSVKPGNLELYVNVANASKETFVITLSNEENETLGSYIYDGSGQESEIGWCKLLSPIEYSGLSYINLLGYIGDSENVLINSYYYEPIIYKINDDHAVFLYIFGYEMIEAYWIDIKETENTVNEIKETAKYKESDNKNIRNGIEINVEKQEGGGRLGIWIIVLIGVAAMTLIGLVAIGAYHLGLNKGIDKNPPYIEDIEPARVVTIPRVKGVTDSPIIELI